MPPLDHMVLNHMVLKSIPARSRKARPGGIVMIAKLVIASLLAGSSVAASGQQAARTAGASAAVWPHMHQCTLSPVGSSFAINTKGRCPSFPPPRQSPRSWVSAFKSAALGYGFVRTGQCS